MPRKITAYEAKPTYEEWTESANAESMKALDLIIEAYKDSGLASVRIGKPFDIEVVFAPTE